MCFHSQEGWLIDCLFKGYCLYSGRTAVSIYLLANRQVPGDISKLNLGLFHFRLDNLVATVRDNAQLCCSYFATQHWSNSALLVTLDDQEYVEFLFDCRSFLCVTKSVTSLSATAEAKAAEAAASAYYSPVNPHNVYMPTVSSCIVSVCNVSPSGYLAILFLSDTAKLV